MKPLHALARWFSKRHHSAPLVADLSRRSGADRRVEEDVFLSAHHDGHLPYRRVAGRYAVVTEGPAVQQPRRHLALIREFDVFCRNSGWRALFGGVSDADVAVFDVLGKQAVAVGQVGVVDLTACCQTPPATTYQTHVYEPPLPPDRLAAVQTVLASARDWDGGLWDHAHLTHDTIVTVEQPADGTVLAFASLPFSYGTAGFCDRIRRAAGVPADVLDRLMQAVLTYARQQGRQTMRLGLSPFPALRQPRTFAEQVRALAYQWLRSDADVEELRRLKDRYTSHYESVYLIYERDWDLLQALLSLQPLRTDRH